MSNNRLYIGNKETLEYIFLEKGYGDGWVCGWFESELVKIIIARNTYFESNLGGKTNLVFFTEYDELHDIFMSKGKKLSIEDFAP